MTNLRNLGPIRLAVISGVAIGLVAFTVFVIMRLGGPDMALLYGELSPADAQRITQRLDALNVPYKLRGDGTQVFVPIEQVPRTRLSLAAEGLPTGGTIGYEIFDRSQGLATSSFQQNVNQLRALEGELARTIGGLDNVRNARVHLVLPQREQFSRERQEASASIVLRMGGPQRIERQQVLAIQHIVAAAVPGLKPDRISVVDERGTLLARGADAGSAANALATAEEMRIAYEHRVARNVEALLERTLGFGRARAEVSVEIDRNRTQENQEEYNPERQVPRSTQTVNETSTSTESDGNPSVTIATNLPQGGQQGALGSISSSSTQRSEETTNFEISRVVRNQVREPGGVSRVSVAVLVGQQFARNDRGEIARDDKGQRIVEPYNAQQMAAFRNIVEAAVGYNAARGDPPVQIEQVRFFELEDEPKPALFLGLDKDELLKLAQIVVLGAVAILVLLLIVRPLVARMFEPEPEVVSVDDGNQLLGPGDIPQLTGPDGTDLIPGIDQDEGYDDLIDINRIEGRVRASSIRKIGEIIDKHPEDVVAILRNWLYQEAT
jgi:flagellar M-ring protein FliF